MMIFIDIASTSHLFQGEEEVMRAARLLAQDLGFGATAAIADTPAGAQAFATAHPGTILPMGEERERLRDLSLPLLLHVEGLEAWARPTQIEAILTFFLMLGFRTAGDLARLTLSSFQERWGETGALFWKRINAFDQQVISPLLPSEELEDYIHLDFPISLASLLQHHTDKSLDYLFARLSGRRLFARKLVVTLHAEYSNVKTKIEIEPNVPCRDQALFATLLENKLGSLDLENPIRDFEVHIVPCPEKATQLDFFEPRTSDSDRLQTLMSLLLQSSIKPGFYEIEPHIMPERAWRIVAETKQKYSTHHKQIHMTSPTYPQLAIAPAPQYGESVMQAPRPTRILKQPRALTIEDLAGLNVLSHHPIERLENAWWDDTKDGFADRDYYFAISSQGQCMWIYQDLQSDEYFLHGYFD